MGRELAVVLITWNSAPFLRRCAEGILGQTLAAREIVVIDNASSDGSADIVRQLLPNAVVIRNTSNVGFAAAANQGIGATTSEWILLVNPDVFLDPDYCMRTVEALERAGERAGSATGKLLRGAGEAIAPTNVIDSRGIRMTRSGRHLDIGAGELDREGDSEREVFGVSGAAALYGRRFLDDVAIDGQAFDADFFAYREDADISWRGQVMGWKALYVPAARAWHVRRVTPEVRMALPPEINMHSVKNRFLLRLKNEGRYLAFRNAPFELARDLVVLGAALTIERTSLPAFAWLWKNRASVLAKRKAIQARRRVSDRELARWFE